MDRSTYYHCQNPYLSKREEEKMVDIIRTLFMVIIAAFLLKSSASFAEDFTYFDSKIDYWNKPPLAKSKKLTKQRIKSEKTAKDEKSFNWDKYLDPKNKEFFKEGDYTPPEPFMELIRRPTDENLQLWFKYQDKKNKLMQRLRSKMETYLLTNKSKLDKKAIKEFENKIEDLAAKQTHQDSKRYRFRFYFDSNCPHCQKMFKTMTQLQSMGFFVEAKQLDNNKAYRAKFPFPVVKASKNELKKFKIKTVPFLLIGDMKEKVVLTLAGYQTVNSIFKQIGKKN